MQSFDINIKNFICCWLSTSLMLALSSSTITARGQGGGDAAASVARVEAMIGRMTLEEKIGQMNQRFSPRDKNEDNNLRSQAELKELIRTGRIGSLISVTGAAECNELQRIAVEESRLKIPLLFAYDVIHGYRTTFPVPLAQAASWDAEEVRRAASVAATEASADGLHWTFAPMLDIGRDPRWGRIVEGFGEDPYLVSVLAEAAVRGFQKEDLSDSTALVACAKHFAGYGAAEGGRDYNTTEISEHTLREIYLPPFKAALDAGVGTLMTGFNDLNGTPATANNFLLRQILKREWNFNGFVVSDANAIGELINHGYSATHSEAATESARAGVDMDMQSSSYVNHLARAVREGRISEAIINDAVRRILRLKFRKGLFENPYTDPERAARVMLSDDHLRTALDVARKSLVLLKNEKNLLPLDRNISRLAVVGPYADSPELHGSWRAKGDPKDVVTVLAGIKSKLSSGTELRTGSTLTESIAAAKESDAVIIVVGEDARDTGEGGSLSSIELQRKNGVDQEELVRAVYATGKPVVLVLASGRPLAITWTAEHVPAILLGWHSGIRGGQAIADALFGDYNPGGKLPVTFPRATGQIPIYYNHKNTGRPPRDDKRNTSKYLDIPSTPLFPFGFGLSYTRFAYSNLKLSSTRIALNGSVTVSVDVQNTGARAGDEVVQLYIRDIAASITRPVKELKGFRRITLAPNEKRSVELKLTPAHLGFYNREMKFVVEQGMFKVWVGSSSIENLETDLEVIAPTRSAVVK